MGAFLVARGVAEEGRGVGAFLGVGAFVGVGSFLVARGVAEDSRFGKGEVMS